MTLQHFNKTIVRSIVVNNFPLDVTFLKHSHSSESFMLLYNGCINRYQHLLNPPHEIWVIKIKICTLIGCRWDQLIE